MQTPNSAGPGKSQACMHDRYLGLVPRLSATLRDPQSHVCVVSAADSSHPLTRDLKPTAGPYGKLLRTLPEWYAAPGEAQPEGLFFRTKVLL